MADYSLRVPALETKPKDLVTVNISRWDLAELCVAITLARFRIETACIGGVATIFSAVFVCQNLAERIPTSHIVSPGAGERQWPMYLMDKRSEPAYLGIQVT